MPDSQPKQKSLTRFAPIALIALALVLALVFRVHERLSLDALYAQAQTFDAFVNNNLAAALGLFVLIYALATTISLPGASILTISGGFLFGTWLGGAGAWILALRYSELHTDGELYSLGYVEPDTWVGRVRRLELGLTWVLNEHAMLRAAFVHSDYANEVLVGGELVDSENAGILQFQISF